MTFQLLQTVLSFSSSVNDDTDLDFTAFHEDFVSPGK